MKKVFLLLTLVAATFSAWGADYTLKRSFGAVAEQMGLIHSTQSYGNPIVLNNIITVTPEVAGYRRDSIEQALYFYKTNEEIKFKAREGATIKTIKLKWKVRYDGGFLSGDKNGTSTITSESTVTVNANSKSFWVRTTQSKNASIWIYNVEVVYSDPNSVVETYSGLPTLDPSVDSEKTFNGDNGLYTWKVRNCLTKSTQKINDIRGIYLKYTADNEGYVAMDGDQEGGIKDISFEYKTANKNLMYHFYIKQDGTTLDEYYHKGPADGNYVYNYNKTLNLKSNTAISIVNPKQETPQNTFSTISPITITPYLLYTKKAVTIKPEDYVGKGTYKNTNLINNTAGEGTITYSIVEADANNIATIKATTGDVTVVGPGTVTVKATWGQVSTTYQLTIQHMLTRTVGDLQTKYGYENDKNYTDIALNDVLTLSSGKYYTTGKIFRYYQKYAPDHFTIQAKAGVIIQSVKFTYTSTNNGTLANKTGTNIGVADQYVSGTTYPVDANSFTCYFGNTSTGTDGRADVSKFEIKYFDPAKGVAVTKSAADFGKQYGLVNEQCSQDLAINHAVTLHADANNTLKYWSDASGTSLNCYRDCGPIDIIARDGATIHYVKISYYSASSESVLTKHWGANGQNIPACDRIASDSILYVNANSLRLYVGNKGTTNKTLCITKIYVNYSDNSEVVVDNFNNCGSTHGESTPVVVEGVDGKYKWSITNFTRGTSDRMYYDQSIKLNAGGKISTSYSGGLKEAAFCWHPTTNANVKFTVKAGSQSFVVDSAAKGGVYTFNFQKTGIKSNGEFSITVDNTSGTGLEFGHISLTPYLMYTATSVNIDAKDYINKGYKYENKALVINTTSPVTYAVSGTNVNQIAAVEDQTKGEVTILGEGTVTVTATADGASTSYELTIHLEDAAVAFETAKDTVFLTDGSYTQTADQLTTADLTYSFVGSHTGAEIDSETGKVTFSSPGTYTIKAKADKALPFKAGEATYQLIVKSNIHEANKTIGQIKGTENWENGSQHPNIPIAESITLSDGKYYSNSQGGEFRYYYGNNAAGKFTIQGKPGVIIQTIKLIYTGDNNTTLADAYYGSNITDASKKIISGTTYKIDANAVTYFVGKTGDNNDHRINVQSYEIKYFDPTLGVAVTKHAFDLAKDQNLQNNTPYQNIALNNAVKLHADQGGTLKYYTSGNFNCYNGNGPIDIIAREGAIIHYVKVTYSDGGDAVLTRNSGGGKNLQASQYIANDSILFVNAKSLRLYVGSKGNDYKTLALTKFYVNYTDTTSVTETFETTPAAGWTLTNCTTGDERVYYDQAVKLNSTSGKVSTTIEGGVKDLSFDWSPVSTGKKVDFKVKFNTSADAITQSSYDKNYVFTYTKTGVKSNNVSFSIEQQSTSATDLKVSRIAITPYLLYTTKEANIALGESYLNTDLINNIDDTNPVVYSVVEGEGVAEFDADGTVTPMAPGKMTIQAKWGDVTTTYTLNVSGALTLDEAVNNKTAIAINNEAELDTVKLIRTLAAGKYNTFCVPFSISKDDLASVLNANISSLATLDEDSKATLDDQHKNLNIVIKEVEAIEAGKPYLLWLESEVANPIFEDVTISTATDSVVSKDEKVTFCGITSPKTIGKDEKSILFVSNNKLAWNNTGSNSAMKGLRAYFYVPGMDASAGVGARLIFHQPQTPTELQNVEGTMQGVRKMIIDNQLVIMRNGMMLNAQGQIVK